MKKPDTGNETLSPPWKIEGRLLRGVINYNSSRLSLPECFPHFSAGRLTVASRPTSNVTSSEKPFLNFKVECFPHSLAPWSHFAQRYYSISHILLWLIVPRSIFPVLSSSPHKSWTFHRQGATSHSYKSGQHLPLPGTWWMGRSLYYYSWLETSWTSLGLWLRARLCIYRSQVESQLGCRKQELPANISDKLLIDSIQSNRHLLRTSSHKNKNLATTTRIPTVCQVCYIHHLIYSV